MSTTRLGGTRTRLNRYASDASDKNSDHQNQPLSGSSSALNGISGGVGSSVHNTNNSSSSGGSGSGGLFTSSYSSVGRSESFGRSEPKGLSMTDGGSYSTLGSQRQYSAPIGVTATPSAANSTTIGGTAGRYVSLSDRISPPVIVDPLRVSICKLLSAHNHIIF